MADFARISGALPRGVTLAGPAMGSPDWTPLLGGFLAGNPRVGLRPLHPYPLKRCEKADTVTIAQLFSSAASIGLAQGVAPRIRLADAHRIPLRVDEMGAVSCGGMPGVSNSFASAVWALNALFALARENVAGVNFQTASYALNRLFTIAKIDGRWRAQVSPVYYGAMMFAQAAPRRLAGCWRSPAAPGRTSPRGPLAQPMGPPGLCSLNPPPALRTVDLRIAGASVPATLERLRAPRLQAQSGVTLAGRRFGPQPARAGSPARPPRARSRPPPACMWSACLALALRCSHFQQHRSRISANLQRLALCRRRAAAC